MDAQDEYYRIVLEQGGRVSDVCSAAFVEALRLNYLDADLLWRAIHLPEDGRRRFRDSCDNRAGLANRIREHMKRTDRRDKTSRS